MVHTMKQMAVREWSILRSSRTATAKDESPTAHLNLQRNFEQLIIKQLLLSK